MLADTSVTERLRQVERANQRLRYIGAANAILLVLLAGSVLTGFVGRSGGPSGIVADSVRVRELVVVDGSGVVRTRIATSLPDAIIGGRRVRRGDAAAGVMLYDRTGQERGGYVTFDTSGTVALTLDTRKGQVAIFAADPDGGAAARLWRADDWVEMRSGDDGTRLSVGANGALVSQIPPMTEQEGAAVCSGLKAEVARLRPPPPQEALVAACRRRAPEAMCRRCLNSR